ncbi:MAG: hypothetical protein QXS11_05105 [Zestosphaera sp.]
MILTTYPPAKTLLQDTSHTIKQLILRELPPAGFTSDVIEKMFKKAVRLKIWKNLKPEARALILALRKWKNKINSPTLKTILEEIYVEIELNTLKGKALLYGVMIALRDGILQYLNTTQETINSLKKLICIGISYLSNPPLYRHLG